MPRIRPARVVPAGPGIQQAEGGGETGGSAAPARRGQGPPETTGKCSICGRRDGLDGMIDHVKRHLFAAPGAGGGDGAILVLFPTTREVAACGIWVLAQVRGSAAASDLVEFLEDEWFRQRIGRSVTITGHAACGTHAPLDRFSTVADLFSGESTLELETDAEYRVRVQRVGEVSCRTDGLSASVVAETFIVPSLQFEALDGKSPRTIQAIPPPSPPSTSSGDWDGSGEPPDSATRHAASIRPLIGDATSRAGGGAGGGRSAEDAILDGMDTGGASGGGPVPHGSEDGDTSVCEAVLWGQGP